MGLADAGPASQPGPFAPMSGGAGGSMAATPVATAEGGGLTWTAPSDWRQKPPSPMRKGSYTVPGDGGAEADLSVTAFPGDVGGELANVNRWRGQLQLPPITDADLPGTLQRIEHNGLRFAVVDIPGSAEPAQRILGASVPFGDATWFFKLTGPSAVVEKARPAFLSFLETVKPAEPSAK